jgi:hypothetical protein
MLILGIDPGPTEIGYALLDVPRAPKVEVPKGPPPARKVAPAFVGPCATCGGERGSPGDRHCRACRRWREKCRHAGVSAPSAGAAE